MRIVVQAVVLATNCHMAAAIWSTWVSRAKCPVSKNSTVALSVMRSGRAIARGKPPIASLVWGKANAAGFVGIQSTQGGCGYAGERDSGGCKTGPGGGQVALDGRG